jgi:tetratricopeptide (TPR) repeat protein
MAFRHPYPESDQEFEDLCVELLSLHWKRPMLKRYGIPGQSQRGVDIIDPTGTVPFHGAQCKLRESHTNFRAKELRDEVDEAKQFIPKLDHYAIVTTAKIPTQTDDELTAINREHAEAGLFVVEIIKYDTLVEEFPQVLYGSTRLGSPIPSDTGTSRIGSDLSDIKVKLDTLLGGSTSGGPQDDISDAVKEVTAKKYAMAHRELSRIREKRWDKLGDLQKYDVAANLAVCCIALNDPSQAAALFLEAVQFKPTDERARTNVALAHALNEHFDKGHTLAAELMNEFPTSPRAAALWISTAPRDSRFADLESRLSPQLLDEEEVGVALGYAALQYGEIPKAEECAKHVTSNTRSDSRGWLLLGMVLVRKEIDKNLRADPDPELMTPGTRQDLLSAKAAFDKAVEMARRDNSLPLLVGSLAQRSALNELLQDSEGQAADIQEAHSLDPSRVDVKRAYAIFLAKCRKTDEAIATLKSIAPHHDNGTRYLLGLFLCQRKSEGDIQEAITLFRTVGRSNDFAPPGLRSHVLHLCIDIGDIPDLDMTLKAIVDNEHLDKLEIGVLECRAMMKANDSEGAKARASGILGALPPSPPFHSTLRLCELLSDLHMYREAFPFWKTVTNKPDVPQVWHRRFLECAYYAGEDADFIDRCELLRSVSLADSNLLHAELDVLEKYDIEACIEILKEYLDSHPDDLETQLRLSVIGYRLNRRDLICTSLGSIPDVDTVRPKFGLAAVQIMKMCGNPQDALRYAYTLSRLHPSDPDAQRAMLFALHPFGPKPVVPEPSEVGCDTSIEFVEEGTSQPNWITIESCDNPPRSFPSVAPDSRLAKGLIGKKGGQTFVLAETPVNPRMATVITIQSKYVHLYQDILNTWQLRFPELHGVYSVRMVNQQGKVDLSPINNAIERRRQYVNGLLDLYVKMPVPIHMFSDALGVTEIDSVAYFARTPKVGLRCCGGSWEERLAAFNALQAAKSVVVDLNALGTLILLGGLDQLKRMPLRVVVAQETVNALLEMLLEQTGFLEAESGVYTKIGSEFGFIPVSGEEKKARAERLAEILEFLREHCQVASCRSLAGMPPTQRNELIKSFGLAGAQSIVLARLPGSVLWTDDWTVATFAANLGVSRVWTQLVLLFLSERGVLREAIGAEWMAKLIGFGYEFAWTNENILAEACRLSGWDLREWPLSQAIDQFRSNNIDLLPLLRIFACFISNLEKQNISDKNIREIVHSLLSRLAVRNDSVLAFQILERDLVNFTSQRIRRSSTKTIPAFLDWLSHYNAVSHHRL